MFTGTMEEYENLRLRNLRREKKNNNEKALVGIILEFLKVVDLDDSSLKRVFNTVRNYQEDKKK